MTESSKDVLNFLLEVTAKSTHIITNSTVTIIVITLAIVVANEYYSTDEILTMCLSLFLTLYMN